MVKRYLLMALLCILTIEGCKPAKADNPKNLDPKEQTDPNNPDNPDNPDSPDNPDTPDPPIPPAPEFEPGGGEAGDLDITDDNLPAEGYPEFIDASDEDLYCATYTLPDPLICSDGSKVTTAEQWNSKRRAEILKLFSDNMFGSFPPKPEGLHFQVLSEDNTVYEGLGTRKYIRIFLDASEEHWFDAMLHLPNQGDHIPVFVFLNHVGNDVTLAAQKSRWPFDLIMSRGFGIITAWHAEIDPDPNPANNEDVHGSFTTGVRSWYAKDCNWGALTAWGWGMSRLIDYLETEPRVDMNRICSLGHSRTGKTSIWAAVNDPRYAICFANCSGCCGAAISRKPDGSNFYSSATGGYYYHWFTPRFYDYHGKPETIPFDQHWLAALMAPRPIYFGCGDQDQYTPPRLEWITALRVQPVYDLFGKAGLPNKSFPAIDEALKTGTIGYHRRTGKHDVTPFDWNSYMDFASLHFGL